MRKAGAGQEERGHVSNILDVNVIDTKFSSQMASAFTLNLVTVYIQCSLYKTAPYFALPLLQYTYKPLVNYNDTRRYFDKQSSYMHIEETRV